jgi:hypothetical protein
VVAVYDYLHIWDRLSSTGFIEDVFTYLTALVHGACPVGRDAGSVVVCGGFQAFDCQVGGEDVFCEVEGRGPGFGFQGLVAFAVAPVAEGAAVADWSAVSVVAVVGRPFGF